MNLLRPFNNLRIRNKLLVSYSIVFILACTLGSIFIYSLVREGIETSIENELENSTTTILNMVRTSASVSIKNHLRAVAEKNREIAEHFYRQYKDGVISEDEAKARTREVMLSQTIGKTGYIFVWNISKAPDSIPLAVHPKIEGKDVSSFDFVQKAAKSRNGYIEYEWKNPGEDKAREKSMYLAYFEPWQWVVAASSYREEFNELVNVDDFRNSILALRFGKTGYTYIIDSRGNIVIHPKLQGNVYDVTDAKGWTFIHDICAQKQGKIVYSWKNPDEKVFREKLSIFNYIPEYDWIVVSSSYLEEFYSPLKTVRNIIIAAVLAILFLFLPISLWISSSITKPLGELMERFTSAAAGDLSVRMERQPQDEVGRLAQHFNNFMERLESYKTNLQAEIRDRKQAENTLRESNARYRGIFEYTKSGVAVYEAVNDGEDFIFVDFNQSGEEIEQVKKADIVGKRVTEVFPGVKEFGLFEVFQRVWATGKSEYHPVTFYKDQRIAGWRDNFIYKLPSGEIVAVYSDETAQKQAEEYLRASEAQYRGIFNSTTDSFLIFDVDGNIVEANPRACIMYGYPYEELLKLSGTDMVHPDYHHLFEQFKTDVQTTGEFHAESVDVRKDGSIFNVEISGSMFDYKGKPHLLAVLRDITERKHLEAQLLHAQKMEAVGTLAGGISHDFNNVLQAISGYVQLLLMRKGKDDPDRNYLEQIDRSIQRAAELVRQLLIFSRKVESKLGPVDLNQEVAQIHKLLGKTIPRMISIEMRLVDGLKTINADPIQLEQIIMNLAVNARDAMPDGGRLIIETGNVVLGEEYSKTHLGAAAGEYVLLTISDTGCGMDSETLEHIFEPFYTTKEAGKGTGLGLASVYGIVKSHGGYIMCYSEPGQGTTFKIYFPVLAEFDGVEQVSERKEKVEIRGGDETILLVDDEKTILDIGSDILGRYGYTTITAESGEGAIDVYEREGGRIDLVILDVGMPGMGGHKCLQELLRIDPEIKIIMTSGYSPSGKVKETLQAGAAGFIGKPYQLYDMLRKVREILDKKTVPHAQ